MDEANALLTSSLQPFVSKQTRCQGEVGLSSAHNRHTSRPVPREQIHRRNKQQNNPDKNKNNKIQRPVLPVNIEEPVSRITGFPDAPQTRPSCRPTHRTALRVQTKSLPRVAPSWRLLAPRRPLFRDKAPHFLKLPRNN